MAPAHESDGRQPIGETSFPIKSGGLEVPRQTSKEMERMLDIHVGEGGE